MSANRLTWSAEQRRIAKTVDGKCLDDFTDRNDVAICIVEELLGRRP